MKKVIAFLVLTFTLCIVWYGVINTVQAETWATRTITFPDYEYTAPYMIFYDIRTGDMFHATTGAVNTTWGNCDVAAAKHASNNAVWTVSVPTLDKSKEIGVLLFDNASPVDTDTVIVAMFYDPQNSVFYTDQAPASKGGIRIFNR